MYVYTAFDRHFVRQRAPSSGDQLERHPSGQLGVTSSARCACKTAGTSSATRPCCARRHPCGELSSRQLRQLAPHRT